jgi:hypothetical protein
MGTGQLRSETSLDLPVFEDSAPLSAGEGHGRQGRGAVWIAAVETALRGRDLPRRAAPVQAVGRARDRLSPHLARRLQHGRADQRIEPQPVVRIEDGLRIVGIDDVVRGCHLPRTREAGRFVDGHIRRRARRQGG